MRLILLPFLLTFPLTAFAASVDVVGASLPLDSHDRPDVVTDIRSSSIRATWRAIGWSDTPPAHGLVANIQAQSAPFENWNKPFEPGFPVFNPRSPVRPTLPPQARPSAPMRAVPLAPALVPFLASLMALFAMSGKNRPRLPLRYRRFFGPQRQLA